MEGLRALEVRRFRPSLQRGADMAKKKAKAATAKPPTKTEVQSAIAEKTGLTKKEVASVFDALSEVIGKNLGRRGPKVFTIPGLVKFKVVNKKATKARKYGTELVSIDEMWKRLGGRP